MSDVRLLALLVALLALAGTTTGAASDTVTVSDFDTEAMDERDATGVQADPLDDECVQNGGEDCRPVWFEPRDEVGEPPWIL